MFHTQNRGASAVPEGSLIAYFCAEYGITDRLPIYSGGLGVLAGDIVQEASDRNLPFVALGLFYKKGFFHQFVDTSGQHESTTVIEPAEVPLELAVDAKGETILIEIPIHERTIYAQIWKFKVGNVNLYLLDTDHWKNSEADRQITDQLYGGDQTKRVMQELVLGVGGLRVLQALNLQPTVYHMNEGHSAFLSLELLHTELAVQNGNLEQAKQIVRQKLVFTNHTLVPAGNDAFPHDLIRTQLGKYAFESGLGIDTVINLGDDGQGHFSMTLLAMRMSRRSNAVSKLHAQKAKQLWPEYKLAAVTNGVYLPGWVAPEWQAVWKDHVPDWHKATADLKSWRPIRTLPDRLVWDTHQHLKEKMLDEIYEREGIRLDADTFTVVWARRFATYKRPDLLFSDLERLKKILFNDDRPMQVIVAGKSHPNDQQGKDIIGHIEYLSNYALKRRAIFVDDYSITLARSLVAGADLWLNTPIFGLEASGTSGMKAASNGVIQFTTPDGWAYEVDWFGLGYALPIHKAETHIYPLLEKKILPTYYKRDRNGVPHIWVSMMKETVATLAPRFSATRMMDEYVHTMYIK